MRKTDFLLLVVLMLVLGASPSEGEEITIATYYPSPVGSYNELKTNKLIIGSGVSPGDAGVISFEALNGPPAKSQNEAMVYYDRLQHALRYYNGAQWVTIPRIERGDYRAAENHACISFQVPFNNLPLVNVYSLSGGFVVVRKISKSDFCITVSERTGSTQLIWIAIGD